jgi:hypothetical protein
MRPRFPLFSNPIDLAHQFWEQLLQKDDLVIDATCGNGKDSLAIALMLLHRGGGALLCLDLQKTAIDHTQKLLQEQAARFFPHVSFFQQSHETFPAMIQKGSVKLIVYNLGYLPGGDKEITTQTETTIKSISQAFPLLCPGGVLSITCYPGHAEGAKEQIKLEEALSSLDPKSWSFSGHYWRNRASSPNLFIIQKII